jgi:hypothetical protein
LQPPEPVVRYERKTPGELIRLDVKKLGRFEQIGQRLTGDRTRQSSTRGRSGGEALAAQGKDLLAGLRRRRPPLAARFAPLLGSS